MGLDSVELVMAWEEHFEIDIPNSLATTLETPRKAIDAIEVILENSSSVKRKWTNLEIENDVCAIVAKQLGVSRQSFALDSFFVSDLGVD